MKLEIQLPKLIEVSDYHDFVEAENYFKVLCNKIQVKELGVYNGMYMGIVYERGMLDEPECQEMIKKMRQKIEGQTWHPLNDKV